MIYYTLKHLLDYVTLPRSFALIKGAINDGGHTSWASGYARKYGYVIGGVDTLVISQIVDGTATAVDEWVLHHSEQDIGSWLDDSGTLHLDVVEWTDSFSYAMKLADERHEQAIYDIERDNSVYLDEAYRL